MSVKSDLLPLLRKCGGEFLSGEEAARMLGVSRSAVCKAVMSLRSDGFAIEAVTNKGYRLSAESDLIIGNDVAALLADEPYYTDITVLKTAESTNTVLKGLAVGGKPEGTVLFALEQTAGKGRFTRSFVSPADSGIYMSLLLRPKLLTGDAVHITTAAAAAVCEAIEYLSGKKAEIKWVNDVLLNGKKVCGILTEASVDIESGGLDYAVLGIGLNVYEPPGGFPEEIESIAGAVFPEKQAGLKNRLAAEIIKRFMKYYLSLSDKTYINSYLSHCTVPGRRITVLKNGGAYPALALGIDEDCRLLVRYDGGGEEALSSGEISIKL